MGPKNEEAKSIDEQGVTGALIRELKGGTRTVCKVEGSGEHGWTKPARTATPD